MRQQLVIKNNLHSIADKISYSRISSSSDFFAKISVLLSEISSFITFKILEYKTDLSSIFSVKEGDFITGLESTMYYVEAAFGPFNGWGLFLREIKLS